MAWLRLGRKTLLSQQGSPRRPWYRPMLEALEDRVLPAAMIFPTALAAVPSPAWQAIGPAPIVGNTSDGGTVSGRITSIVVDPNDQTGNTIYVGSAGGGVWQTQNLHSAS